MTRNYGPLHETLDLETAVELLPRTELAHYRHKEFANAVKGVSSNRVMRHPTLDEVLEAQKTGEKVKVFIMHGYKLSMLGDGGRKDSEEAVEDYLLGEPGDRKFALLVEENSYWKEVTVTQVTTNSKKGKLDTENWGFVGTYGYVSGSGYYEDWKEADMTFVCKDGIMNRLLPKD